MSSLDVDLDDDWKLMVRFLTITTSRKKNQDWPFWNGFNKNKGQSDVTFKATTIVFVWKPYFKGFFNWPWWYLKHLQLKHQVKMKLFWLPITHDRSWIGDKLFQFLKQYRLFSISMGGTNQRIFFRKCTSFEHAPTVHLAVIKKRSRTTGGDKLLSWVRTTIIVQWWLFGHVKQNYGSGQVM